eukprot:CAMPEP_0202488810 /NCGR_PEP_ID=MMETSP1361-20130828/6758_1 /ASSEMBLY_ACC=CAM_ASM_000849 /TAXON_ID=210615 /ORGANISM="Staurosira complex sp., Strain CCMP2646" /LENGTH=110 /DNA_ID=CAMNT_0049118467 /DNA_START=134 /DNA_END=466 /DNA_ORIENTATION=-
MPCLSVCPVCVVAPYSILLVPRGIAKDLADHVSYILTHVFLQSDEEPVDPLPKFREQCVSKCPDYKHRYDACVKRIEAKGEGDCESWYFELVHCVDACALPKVFKTLKGE